MTELKIIGKIHSSLKSLEECPRQEHEHAPSAKIEIASGFTMAAQNIKSGDRIIVLTWLDRADRTVMMTHPRNDTSHPLTGVFSTRSPDRPNPIGLHFVTVKNVSGYFIELESLEVLDQTPVIDIKSGL